MAVSASFHRNVFLLNQVIPPSDDFKKLFRQGMFDKPNAAGFVHVSHYLLTIYDANRFKKLVEWPIVCKKTEAKYRNDVKDYLNVISLENPDIGFPPILTTYLHHASGTKFTIIMWKLSQIAMRTYIMHQGDHEVIFMPKLGPESDLARTYLQCSTAKVTRNVWSRHRNYVQMEKAANLALEEGEKELSKIKEELFDRRQSMAKHVAEAPVAAAIKQRLMNLDDTEVIEMWKSSLDKNVHYIQKRNAILRDLERVCENISNVVSNLRGDAEILDGKQLQKVNCGLMSELPLPLDVQHYLLHLYNSDKLVYHSFICLFASILYQKYQSLKRNNLMDLSQCLLQVEASIEDIKSIRNVFDALLTNLKNFTAEAQNVLCKKNAGHVSEMSALPLVKSVLFMPSPLIKIDINCADEKNDLHKLLQFTPGEVTHKSLFSKYTRHNLNLTPDLRTNLFVSRINIDDAMLLNSERQTLSTRFVTPCVNRLYKKMMEKYPRLFSTYTSKNVNANCSMMSLPSTTQANSSAITSAMGKMPDFSDLDLDITAKGFFNLSEKLPTPLQCTPVKRLDNSQHTFEEMRNISNHVEIKMRKPELDELTELRFISDEDEGTIVTHENVSRRKSIGDLVERYKKLVEASNRAAMKFQSGYTKYEFD